MLAGGLFAAANGCATEDSAAAARIAEYARHEVGYTTICRSNESVPVSWERDRARYECYQLGKSIVLQELEAAGYVVELEAAEPSNETGGPGEAGEARKRITLQLRRR